MMAYLEVHLENTCQAIEVGMEDHAAAEYVEAALS